MDAQRRHDGAVIGDRPAQGEARAGGAHRLYADGARCASDEIDGVEHAEHGRVEHGRRQRPQPLRMFPQIPAESQLLRHAAHDVHPAGEKPVRGGAAAAGGQHQIAGRPEQQQQQPRPPLPPPAAGAETVSASVKDQRRREKDRQPREGDAVRQADPAGNELAQCVDQGIYQHQVDHRKQTHPLQHFFII